MQIIKPGKFIVTYNFSTRAGANYYVGDIIEILGKTTVSPYFLLNPGFYNWVVKCKVFEPPAPQSIWSDDSIKSLIALRSLAAIPKYNNIWNMINL